MDVKSAYLNSPINTAIYMCLPPGHNQKGKVALVKWGLYGLCQSGNLWHKTLTSTFNKLKLRSWSQHILHAWWQGDDHHLLIYQWLCDHCQGHSLTLNIPTPVMQLCLVSVSQPGPLTIDTRIASLSLLKQWGMQTRPKDNTHLTPQRG